MAFGQTGIQTNHIFLQEERVMRKLFVVLTTVAVVLAFTLPAMAQSQWSFYGSARMWTSYEKVSKEVPVFLSSTVSEFVSGTGTRATAWGGGTSGISLQDDAEIDWKLQTNSRVGALVKWGDISGAFEYGTSGGNANIRLLYGKWNFSKDGQIEVGQDYTPYFYLVSGLCGPGGGECNGIGFGSIYGGRRAQVRVNYMGFSFALIEPNSTTFPVHGNTAFYGATSTSGTPFIRSITTTATDPATALAAGTAYGDFDQTMPKIEASYTANVGPVNLFVGGVWNQYKVEYVTPTAAPASNKVDTTINAWGIGLGGKFAYGPFYLNAEGQYAKNPNNGVSPATIIPSGFFLNPVTNKSEDADWITAQGIIGFKLSDMISFEGGYVYQNAKVKDPGATAATTSLDLEETTGTWYVQSVISPAKNFYIVPEFGMIDYQDLKVSTYSNRKLGDLLWFGIKWQINF
jgi:hypothetical protein